MHIETGVRAQKALSAEDSAALLTLLWLMPNNLYHATESEALTINNVGLLSLESGVFHAAASCRSKLGSCEEQLVRHCMELGQLFGLRTECQCRYRPWPYVEHSPLRELTNRIAQETFGYMLREEVCPGGLEIIPSDIIDLTGFTDMTYTFALPFVLASFGTSMSISGLKSEGKAVLTAVLAVACIVGLGVIAGFTFMDLRTAIYGPIEVTGGGQAGLVFLTALREKSGTESSARALDYVLALCRSFGFRTKNANYRYGYAEIGEGKSCCVCAKFTAPLLLDLRG